MKVCKLLVLVGCCGSVGWGQCSAPDDPNGPLINPGVMGGREGIERLISLEAYDQMFKGTRTIGAACEDGLVRLTYEGLVLAARHFPEFCNTGNEDRDRLELAAFLAHVSHETTGGWAGAPCGKTAYGLCFPMEVGCSPTSAGCDYTSGDCKQGQYENVPECTPRSGKKYFGRGPIQLSYNYNYAAFSQAFYGDYSVLLDDPDRVATNPEVAWASAIWFWMTPQHPKESCHQAMVAQHEHKGSQGGFGLTTMIINGGIECGGCTMHSSELDRIQNFKRYSWLLGVPLCWDKTHVVTCGQVQSYPFWSLDNPPCPEDHELCELSNINTCYQFDASENFPAGNSPDSTCTNKGLATTATKPKTRTKATCILPNVPYKTEAGYDSTVRYYCQETYDTVSDNTPTEAPTEAPTQAPTEAPKPDEPNTTATPAPVPDTDIPVISPSVDNKSCPVP